MPTSPTTGSRRPPLRLVVAIAVAVLLGGYLMYQSLIAGSERAVGPSALEGRGAQVFLGGIVVPESIAGESQSPDGMTFTLRDEANQQVTAVVRYRGSLPAEWRQQRVMVKGTDAGAADFVANPGSMTTRCPSKFQAAQPERAGS